MDDTNQQAFIGRIRYALGHAARECREAGDRCTAVFSDKIDERLDRIRNRTADEKRQILERLIEMAKPINLNVFGLKDEKSVAAAIADLVQNKVPEWGNDKKVVAWGHPLLERLNLGEALASQKVPVYVTEPGEDDLEEKSGENAREVLRQLVIGSYIGITSADFCMADTATLVMRTRPGQARSVSLVPSIHVAVIHIDQLIFDLKELYTLLQWDPQIREEGLTNCMTFISGPSKTADVEATMVHGAHGPREVYIYVITG